MQHEGVRTLFFQGIYGVQTFFVISGFIIPYAMHRAGYHYRYFSRFFAKRLLRLEPPYLFSLTAAVLLLLLRSHIMHIDTAGLEPARILLHLGYLIPFFSDYHWLNEVYWTLAIEFQFYLLMGLLFTPLLRATQLQRIFIYATLLLSSGIGSYQFLPNVLPFFLMGILLFLYSVGRIGVEEFGMMLLIALTTAAFRHQPAALVFGLLPVAAVLFARQKRVPGLDRVGRVSYSLYLLHPLVGGTFINVFSHRINHPFEKIVVVAAGLILTLVAAALAWKLVERPSQRLSRRISYEKQPA